MTKPTPRQIGQWAGLLVLSLILGEAAQWAGLPAALLLGAMVGSIAVGVSGGSIRVPRPLFLAAQTIIGALVARALTPETFATLSQDWVTMLTVILTTVAAGGIVGWVLARFGSLPGNTAAWGSSPGGASAMVVMAEDYGADPRLVAFMQYLRMLLVVMSAALATRLLAGPPGTHGIALAPETLTWTAVAGTLGIALVGGTAGKLLKVPGGALLGPMLLGAVVHSSGLVHIALPDEIRNGAYVVIGWYIGLSFNRTVLMYALRALPQMLLSTFLLIALCGASAWALTWTMHTDPLTAYLATSPGGLDSIAIIAMDQPIDLSFVLALQTLRVFIVILTGPILAKLITRLTDKRV